MPRWYVRGARPRTVTEGRVARWIVSVSRMRASAALHPLANPSRSAWKRWMQLAVILQSVQTPFRCVRRESDPTQSRVNLSTGLRIVFYRSPRYRCAHGDAVDRDDILTRRDRPPRKEKDLLARLGQGIRPSKSECMRVSTLLSKSVSVRSLARYHYALRWTFITRLSALRTFSRRVKRFIYRIKVTVLYLSPDLYILCIILTIRIRRNTDRVIDQLY